MEEKEIALMDEKSSLINNLVAGLEKRVEGLNITVDTFIAGVSMVSSSTEGEEALLSHSKEGSELYSKSELYKKLELLESKIAEADKKLSTAYELLEI